MSDWQTNLAGVDGLHEIHLHGKGPGTKGENVLVHVFLFAAESAGLDTPEKIHQKVGKGSFALAANSNLLDAKDSEGAATSRGGHGTEGGR